MYFHISVFPMILIHSVDETGGLSPPNPEGQALVKHEHDFDFSGKKKKPDLWRGSIFSTTNQGGMASVRPQNLHLEKVYCKHFFALPARGMFVLPIKIWMSAISYTMLVSFVV